MMLSPKQKLYTISAAFIIIILLIIFAVVFPLIEKIKSSNLTLEKQKIASENFYKNWKNLASAKLAVEQIREKVEDLGVFLPKDAALKFIVATEKISQETGNRENISIASTPTSKKENALELQISLSGNFSNLLNFLVQMEAGPYFNNLNSLQIVRTSTKDDQNNKSSNINSALNLSAYYQ